MDHILSIESAEVQYKQILEKFFISVYAEESLSSHGLNHHRRVWSYSRELLDLDPFKKYSGDPIFVSELIIASYLHDIGMSVDPGVKHGKYSKELCLRFLSENGISENQFPGLLQAIENHDNKNYSESSHKNDLLKILSIADDLDAFGFIGIFRYAEIYLIRGIAFENIGLLIRQNAEKRFNNLESGLGSAVSFVENHRNRYKILDDFFIRYEQQIPSYQFGTSKPSAYCGIIELFSGMMKEKTGLKPFFKNPAIKDPVFKWFFSGLESEMKP